MTTSQYIDSINQRYKLGNATEHTFRGSLEQLIITIGVLHPSFGGAGGGQNTQSKHANC